MSVAIEISPELMIIDKPSGASYRLDTGKEDFNRVISSDKLSSSTLNFGGISVDGFDSYLYFKDLAAVSEFVKLLKINGDKVDVKPYLTKPLKDEPKDESIIIVFGSVSISLAGDTPTSVDLARPVYRVYPDAKTSALYPVQDIHAYINETWQEECKQALFSSGDDASQRVGTVRQAKVSDNSQLKFLKLAMAFAALIIAIVALGVVLNDQNAVNTAQAHPSAMSAHALMNPNPQLASVPSANPASAVYGGGYTGQQGQATVEDFARLQVEQTQGMLKDMGVDVQSGSQNLGCFAEEKS